MTQIFAVYLQTSGFPYQSLEYAFECCPKQTWRYDISLPPLLILILLLSAYVDCRRAVDVYILQVFDVQIFYPLFLK